MKQIIFLSLALALLNLNLKAQDVSADAKSLNSKTLKASSGDTIMKASAQDTAVMHIGKKECKVISNEGRTTIVWGKNKNKKDDSNKFKGHWEGLEFGFNAFDKADYSMYNPVDNNFMSLNQGKSVEFDFNFYQLNISLAKSYVGLVSGMGLSFNNYRFDNHSDCRHWCLCPLYYSRFRRKQSGNNLN